MSTLWCSFSLPSDSRGVATTPPLLPSAMRPPLALSTRPFELPASPTDTLTDSLNNRSVLGDRSLARPRVAPMPLPACRARLSHTLLASIDTHTCTRFSWRKSVPYSKVCLRVTRVGRREGGREEGLKSFTFLIYSTLNGTKGDR